MAQRRREAGEPVSAIVRRHSRAVELRAAGIDARSVSLDDTSVLTWGSLTGRTVVYLVPPPRDGDDDPRIAHLLSGLPADIARFVYISTTGVYGNHDGAQVDENTPPNPESARAARRLSAETRVREWAGHLGIAWTILRVPGIYGPGRLQLATVRERRPMLRITDAGPGNRIHVDDLARAVEAAALVDAPSQVINVGDGNPMSNTQFVALVAAQLGVEAPPQIDRATMRAQASDQAWSFMRESRRVDVTRMRDVLGVVPRYQPADGIAASLAAMRAAGEL